jgi:hypothetical protein
MKSSIKLTLVFLLLSSVINNNVKAQGYKFSKEKTKAITRQSDDNYGFTGKTLPTSYSLRKWAPTPGTQEGNTCVGWAMSYAAMSITYNIALNNTDSRLKNLVAFDPVLTYALALDRNQKGCEETVYYADAISQMLKYGCKRMVMPPVALSCEQSVYDYNDAFSSPFTPNNIYALDLEKLKSYSDKLNAIKGMIAAGSPLPFGVETPKSLLGDGNGNPLPTGLWQPKVGEEMFGGHAMCVIGYSDSKYGGAFEIMNSWGTEFGEGGFFWIKYNDFIQRVQELIYIEPVTIKSGNCKLGNCNDEYSIIKSPKGSMYEGFVKNQIPEGYGIFQWPDNDVYAGGWSNGKQDGKGIIFSKSEIYKCYYSNGELLSSEPLGFGKSETSDVTDKIIKELAKNKTAVKSVIPAKVFESLENKSVDESWK